MPEEDLEMERRALWVIFLLALFLWPQFSEASKKNLTVSLDKREIRDLSSQGLVLVFFLKVANHTNSPYYLEQVDYRVVVREKDYFSLKTTLEEPILMQPAAQTSISFPVKITYSFLFETVEEVEPQARVSSYITGLIMFSDGRRIKEKVPFAFAAEFPIFRDLDIGILPLRVKSLSLGGAEIIFAFTWENPNSFDLELDKSFFKIKIGGKTVAEGELSGGGRIESRSEKEVSIPLMLDFFELGREFQAVLEQPSVECELFSGLEARTVWAPIKLEVSKKETVAVEKKNDGLRHHSNL